VWLPLLQLHLLVALIHLHRAPSEIRSRKKGDPALSYELLIADQQEAGQ
jgi:hypothetical protein